MAPIKFEEHIKSQLEERRIAPSSDLWSQLDDKLEEEETRHNHKWFWWMGIAASLVGILLMVTLLFGNDEVLETETMVESSEQPSVIESSSEALIKPVSREVLVTPEAEQVVANTEHETLESKTTIAKEKTKPEQAEILKKEVPVVVLAEEDKAVAVAENTIEIEKDLPVTKPDFETQKAQEVVAEILKLQQENASVSDAEIDALLKAAEKEITRQKIFDESRNTVDADALLQSVEEDLDASFRQRVFDMLKSGYKEVKTALAERNN